MFRLIILSITQAILMCSAQSLFKVAAEHMGSFSWTWVFFRDGVLTNWWLIASGLCGIIGTLDRGSDFLPRNRGLDAVDWPFPHFGRLLFHC